MKTQILKRFALAFWYVAHFVAFLYINIFGYYLPKFIESKNVTYPSFIEVFDLFLKINPVLVVYNPELLLLAALFLLTMVFWSASAVFAKMLKRLSLVDVYEITQDALFWGVRNFFLSGIFPLSVLFCFGVGVYPYLCRFLVIHFGVNLYSELNVVSLFLIKFLIETVFVIVFGVVLVVVLNKRFFEADHVDKWYRINWPGWQTPIILLVGYAAMSELDFIVDTLAIGIWPVEVAFQVVWYVLDVFAYGVLLSVLVYRIRWRELTKELHARANIKFCAAWLLLDVRFFVIALWVTPPFIVAAIAYIDVVPWFEENLTVTGATAGTFFNTFVFLAQGFSSYWYFIVLPLGVLVLMIYGRFLLLYDHLPLNTSLNLTRGAGARSEAR
jgi:hypothetical protein